MKTADSKHGPKTPWGDAEDDDSPIKSGELTQKELEDTFEEVANRALLEHFGGEEEAAKWRLSETEVVRSCCSYVGVKYVNLR